MIHRLVGEGCSLMRQSKSVVVAVDDDRRVRESIQSVLESAGYETEVYASAETLFDSGCVARSACVVADVKLPGMDGIELQRRIRLQLRDMPVIFITAHDDDDIRQQALRGGAVAFMVKPFDAGELLERIDAVLKAA
jgi:FixJ family two-component response regulator